jgi:hypothetical protein
MKKPRFNPPSTTLTLEQVNTYFWQQRETWHAEAVEVETRPKKLAWHRQRLANARSKLSEGEA